MHLLAKVKVPRCYFHLEYRPIGVQLQCFCDASEFAYAAVLYVRYDYGNDHIETRLVAAKTRVAPVKQQTIPRLKLLGALILARLLRSVIVQLKGVSQIYCWTDFMTVLQWIKNKNKHVYRQYVQKFIKKQMVAYGDIVQETLIQWICPQGNSLQVTLSKLHYGGRAHIFSSYRQVNGQMCDLLNLALESKQRL